MRNVTISLDDDLVRRAKVEAAKRDLSLSRYIAGMLEDALCREDDYERAMREFFELPDELVSFPGGRPPSRDELYDRTVPPLRGRNAKRNHQPR